MRQLSELCGPGQRRHGLGQTCHRDSDVIGPNDLADGGIEPFPARTWLTVSDSLRTVWWGLRCVNVDNEIGWLIDDFVAEMDRKPEANHGALWRVVRGGDADVILDRNSLVAVAVFDIGVPIQLHPKDRK